MITSAANSRIKQVVQWQSKARERKKDGVYLVEGIKMYREAPTEDILEVYVSEDAEDKVRELNKHSYEVVSAEVFRKMSDTQTPQGVLTVLRQPRYTLDMLLAQEPPLLVILENIQDPGNLGTILRTGEGAGVTGIIMTDQTVDIFNPKTIRATMGSIYRVPFVYISDMKETIARLHADGVHTYAAHLQGSNYYDSFSFKEPTAFIIGNEGNGLRKETAEMAEYYLKIPMEGQVESLNAAMATGLLMYEAHRQRKNNGSYK